MARLLQPAFTRGELSPLLRARVDTALYQVGLRKLRNMFVRTQGGVSNRAGLPFVGIAASNDEGGSVLIPFIFSTEQAYILEFSAGAIRVFANGAFIPSGVGTATITNVVVSGGPALFFRTITTSAPHGYNIGDLVHIAGLVASGTYQVNGSHRITGTSANTFDINEMPALADKGSYISGGTVSLDVNVVNPYDADELADLRFAQSADVLTVTHPAHPQYEFRRLSASSFEFVQAEFEDGPFLDTNLDFSYQMHASQVLGTVSITGTRSVFLEAHEGALLRLQSRNLSLIQPWESGGIIKRDSGSTLGVLRRSEGRVYKCVTDQTPSGANKIIRSGSVRPVHEFGVQPDGSGLAISADIEREGVSWEYLHSGFGIARITSYSSGTVVLAQVLRRLPDDCAGGVSTAFGPFTMTGDGVDVTLSIAGATSHNKYDFEVTYNGVIQEPALFEVNATTDVLTFYAAPATGVSVSARQLSTATFSSRTDLWAFGAWSDVQGYPSVVSYHQDRLFYGASTEQPQTVWGSRTGSYKDYGVSVPIADDDSVNFTMNGRQINAIRDLIPLDKLVAMTAAGAWVVTDGENEVLTPSTVGFKPQSYRGAKRLRTILVGDEAVFVHDAGRKIRTLGYRFDTNKFGGVDLIVAAEHLLTKDNTAVDMDYAEEPHTLLHVVREDGEMPVLTYEPEQEVTAWSHYDTLDGQFERVCVIPEDTDSAAYVIVRREIGSNTVRYIERFADRFDEDPIGGVYADSALSFDGRNTSDVTLTLEFPIGPGTIILTASDDVFSLANPPDLVTLTIEDADGNSYSIRGTFASISDPTQMEITSIEALAAEVQDALEGRSTTVWALGFDEFNGLHHLEGATVCILADGGVEEDQLVTGGQITLASPATVVHVGLRVTAEMETLDVNIPGEQTVRGNAKHIGKVDVICYRSRNILVGPDADHLDEIATRTPEDDEYDAESLKEDIQDLYIATTLSKNGRVLIRHDEPLPLTVLGVIPSVEFGTNG
jgi:hypothetical protein